MRRVLKLHLIMTQSDCPEVTMCSGQGVKKEGRKKEVTNKLIVIKSKSHDLIQISQLFILVARKPHSLSVGSSIKT